MRIEEWKNRGEIKHLWRYVVTALAVIFSLPVGIMTLLAFLTVSLGMTFDEPGVTQAVMETGFLIRFIHLVNFGLMGLFYYLVIQFTLGVNWTYKYWVLLSVALIPFLYYLAL